MIKGRRPCPFRGVNQQELAAFRGRDPIPEAIIRLPCWSHAGAKDERVCVVRHPLFSSCVIRRGERARRIGLLGHDGKCNH